MIAMFGERENVTLRKMAVDVATERKILEVASVR